MRRRKKNEGRLIDGSAESESGRGQMWKKGSCGGERRGKERNGAGQILSPLNVLYVSRKGRKGGRDTYFRSEKKRRD